MGIISVFMTHMCFVSGISTQYLVNIHSIGTCYNDQATFFVLVQISDINTWTVLVQGKLTGDIGELFWYVFIILNAM